MYRHSDEAMLSPKCFLLFRFRKSGQADDLIRADTLGIVRIQFFENVAECRIVQHFRLL